MDEDDFAACAAAALDARDRGETDRAKRLDRLARKINASLIERASGRATRWQDMPSLIEKAA